MFPTVNVDCQFQKTVPCIPGCAKFQLMTP
jgi:hypothetical protein